MTLIKGKTKTIYRITCPNFGTRGHSTHVHTKATLEKARERTEGNDHLYENMTKSDDGTMYSYYRSEIGWRVQSRIEMEWEDV